MWKIKTKGIWTHRKICWKKYLENYLIQKFNLVTLYVSNRNSIDFTKRDETQAQCKILTTNDFPTNPKFLIIIQGAGAVRLG